MIIPTAAATGITHGGAITGFPDRNTMTTVSRIGAGAAYRCGSRFSRLSPAREVFAAAPLSETGR
jgi:hypothetical protein